ncbi:hypothetical protein DM02DRAFT_366081 [Periconia macrospinosa]|uniref:Aminoglycoside phosphotransferase domain-containing protein n=1 Tax=Periconia macrospinosa TaxID=97972 RepID=A0A2V1D1R0_9PLEO|nr:hypothetical protein DM02DRAFT_366081 [Periconia macrospinosa]
MPTLKPVRESIVEVGDNSWVIGDEIFLSRQCVAPHSGCFWSDGAGSFYTISAEPAIQPLPQTSPLSPSSPIQLVHDAGDCNAAWRIGEAFLKVQLLDTSTTTREHTTLAYLHDPANGPIPTFPIPHVLYHKEINNRYYLITTRVPGETLEKAWPTMDESAKRACVDRVVDICKELARRENDKICCIDGGDLCDNWMKPPHASDGYSHDILLSYCKEIGVDCSAFALYHCDMGPKNVIVDLTQSCIVGLVDWEKTGFVPKGWIRTKFCVCWAMDFDYPGEDVEQSQDWRQRVQLRLAQEDFPEVADAWRSRFRKAYQNR